MLPVAPRTPQFLFLGLVCGDTNVPGKFLWFKQAKRGLEAENKGKVSHWWRQYNPNSQSKGSLAFLDYKSISVSHLRDLRY